MFVFFFFYTIDITLFAFLWPLAQITVTVNNINTYLLMKVVMFWDVMPCVSVLYILEGGSKWRNKWYGTKLVISEVKPASTY